MASKNKSGVKRGGHSDHEQSLAIISLILNIVILPGLGSLIAGKTKSGVWQIVLFLGGLLLGAALLFNGFLIGLSLMILGPIIGWVWGIVTGAKLIRTTHTF